MCLACSSVPYELVTQRNVEKSKLVQTFPTARISGMPVFSWKGQRSRLLVRHQNTQETATYLVDVFTYQAQAPTANWVSSLSMPEMLGKRMDVCISCRHSALTLFLVFSLHKWSSEWQYNPHWEQSEQLHEQKSNDAYADRQNWTCSCEWVSRV